ncbi:methyl-accepting chemotaxis protein [Conexibacter sp. SYSU D00693]|uniref:methyl-accepting chemotaxis protein n=1 Tax=Conexibacter sp. SYSU D00693 TaxID=2812560 RepID=UPI00196BAA5F|nr:methyl-accepting chemotaxis protein [Conexibacter sp. SYSU D00693]
MLHRRIGLRTKLLGGFGAVLALMSVLSLIAISKMAAIQDGTEVANNRVIPSIAAVDDITLEAEKIRGFEYRHISSPTPKGKKEADAKIAEATAGLRKVIADYRNTVSDPRERQFLDRAKGDVDRMLADVPTIIALSRAGQDLAAVEAMAKGRTAFMDQLRKTLDTWAVYNDEVGDRAYAEGKATAATATKLTVALLAGALVIGLAVAFLLSAAIRRNVASVVERLASLRDHDVTDLEAGLQAFAAGDLTHEVRTTTVPIERWSNDEVGDVAQATNAIIGRLGESVGAYAESRRQLAELVGEVSNAAQSVSAGSQQMAATSEQTGRAVGEIAHAISDVATGAQRQVETIAGVRRSAEEVSTVTEASARSAQETAEAASRAREIAADGASAVVQATEAMTAVRDASERATGAIRELGAKSDQIGSIVDTITGISEQTNLLALNAAIEAARAGEQGRGFAVVAEEVRKLAEESQAAARSIAELIAEIQSETGRAIEVVESGSGRTAEGAATVEQAREAFDAIGSSVEDVTARVAQIATGIQQVAASATGMRDDVTDVSAIAEESSASTEQVSASTQETSASAQEISASAGELARTAERLSELVGRFTVA